MKGTMPILIVEKDMAHELHALVGSVRCVLTKAANNNLIPSETRLYMVPALDPTIDEMTNFMHALTTRDMTRCANQGVAEDGMLVMRNSCMVAFGKACEATILVFNNKDTSSKIDIMLDPRRCAVPDLIDDIFCPEPTPEVCEHLATLWSQLDGDTTLDKGTLRRIGATIAYGALLFFAHRDYMFDKQEDAALTEEEVQMEMRATIEYVLRIGVSFALKHILRVFDDPQTSKVEIKEQR